MPNPPIDETAARRYAARVARDLMRVAANNAIARAGIRFTTRWGERKALLDNIITDALRGVSLEWINTQGNSRGSDAMGRAMDLLRKAGFSAAEIRDQWSQAKVYESLSETSRAGLVNVTPGMANVLSRSKAIARVCAKCKRGVPAYPGRYPTRCPMCKGELGPRVEEARRELQPRKPATVKGLWKNQVTFTILMREAPDMRSPRWYWTGTKWVKDEKQAKRYDSRKEASPDLRAAKKAAPAVFESRASTVSYVDGAEPGPNAHVIATSSNAPKLQGLLEAGKPSGDAVLISYSQIEDGIPAGMSGLDWLMERSPREDVRYRVEDPNGPVLIFEFDDEKQQARATFTRKPERYLGFDPRAEMIEDAGWDRDQGWATLDESTNREDESLTEGFPGYYGDVMGVMFKARRYPNWFVPQSETKSGGYKGLWVDWEGYRGRKPRKAIKRTLNRFDVSDMGWTKYEPEGPDDDVYDAVRARFAEKGALRESLLDERKPNKGKKWVTKCGGKYVSHGDPKAVIQPGTKTGDAYCARSAKIKDKGPCSPNALSRKKWRCRGAKSMKESFDPLSEAFDAHGVKSAVAIGNTLTVIGFRAGVRHLNFRKAPGGRVHVEFDYERVFTGTAEEAAEFVNGALMLESLDEARYTKKAITAALKTATKKASLAGKMGLRGKQQYIEGVWVPILGFPPLEGWQIKWSLRGVRGGRFAGRYGHDFALKGPTGRTTPMASGDYLTGIIDGFRYEKEGRPRAAFRSDMVWAAGIGDNLRDAQAIVKAGEVPPGLFEGATFSAPTAVTPMPPVNPGDSGDVDEDRRASVFRQRKTGKGPTRVYGGTRFTVGSRKRKPRKDVEASIQNRLNARRGLARRIEAARKWHQSYEGRKLHKELGRYNTGNRRGESRVGSTFPSLENAMGDILGEAHDPYAYGMGLRNSAPGELARAPSEYRAALDKLLSRKKPAVRVVGVEVAMRLAEDPGFDYRDVTGWSGAKERVGREVWRIARQHGLTEALGESEGPYAIYKKRTSNGVRYYRHDSRWRLRVMSPAEAQAALESGAAELAQEPPFTARRGDTSWVFESEGYVSRADLAALESMLDRLFADVGLDIEFTRHFFDRVNDRRNRQQITTDELSAIFREVYRRHASRIRGHGADWEAIIRDITSDINIPFVLEYDRRNRVMELIAKTVMRKKGFKTRGKTLTVQTSEARRGGGDPPEVRRLARKLYFDHFLKKNASKGPPQYLLNLASSRWSSGISIDVDREKWKARARAQLGLAETTGESMKAADRVAEARARIAQLTETANPIEFNTKLAKLLKKLKKDIGASHVRQGYKGTGSKKYRRQLFVGIPGTHGGIDIWLEAKGAKLGGVLSPISRPAPFVPYSVRTPEAVYEDIVTALKLWLESRKATMGEALTKAGQEFVGKKVRKHMKKGGKPQKQAVAIALDQARRAGYDVPEESVDEARASRRLLDHILQTYGGPPASFAQAVEAYARAEAPRLLHDRAGAEDLTLALMQHYGGKMRSAFESVVAENFADAYPSNLPPMPAGVNDDASVDDIFDSVMRRLIVIESTDVLEDANFDENGSIYLFFDPSLSRKEIDEVFKWVQQEHKDLQLVASPDQSLAEETARADWWVMFLPGQMLEENGGGAAVPQPEKYAREDGEPAKQQAVVMAPPVGVEKVATEIDTNKLMKGLGESAPARWLTAYAE